MAGLRAKLLEVLGVGGPRKRSILKALALKLGFTEGEFDRTMAALKRERVTKPFFQYGGQRVGLRRQRGFVIPPLVLVLGGIALALTLLGGGYKAGGDAARSQAKQEKLDAIAAGQERQAEVSDSIKEAHDRLALATARATENDRKAREALNAARRNKLVLGSCPAQAAPAAPSAVGGLVPGEPAGSGVRAPGVGAGGARVLVHWAFVGLHDGAFTGSDGEPLFRAAALFAGDPARASTPSPYGLDELAEVNNDNAYALSTCRREYFGAIRKLRNAEAAFGRGDQ